MKKAVTILCLIGGLTTLAQNTIEIKHVEANVTVAANGTINASTVANGNTKVTLDLKNTGSSSNSYKVKRYDISLNTVGSTQATAYFCFAGNCYGSIVTSASGLTLSPGQSASDLSGQFNVLVSDLDEASAVGASIVKYTFSSESNSSDSLQITINYNQALGVKDQAAKTLNSVILNPNPSSDGFVSIKVNSGKQTEGSINIYNSLGGLQGTKKCSFSEGKNMMDLNLSDLNNGIYFITVRTADGSSATRKLVIR